MGLKYLIQDAAGSEQHRDNVANFLEDLPRTRIGNVLPSAALKHSGKGFHSGRKTFKLDEAQIAGPDENKPTDLDLEEFYQLLGKAMNKFDALEVDIIRMHFSKVNSMTLNQIAIALNIPEGTVKSRLSRIYTKLREALGPRYSDQP